MTQIRWGGKWVHLAYICIVCHLSAKNYQNRWKFDAVLTKTNLLSFLETRCRDWPVVSTMLSHLTLQRGPIRIQDDFRKFTCMYNKSTSTWHAFTSCCKLQTEGAIIRMSSAYNTTKQRWLMDNWLTMSFKNTTNNCGESTEPWRTPNLTWIKSDITLLYCSSLIFRGH